MLHLKITIFCLFVICSANASAWSPLFEIDSRVNLNQLAQSGEIAVFASRDGRNFRADASAVLDADFGRLAAVSADYNRYKAMGMPYLLASHTVGQAGPDILYTWNWMQLSIMGFSEVTKHCFEVRFSRGMTGGAAGSAWEIHPCPSDAKNHLPQKLRPSYSDDPAFEYLNGSWYMHPVRVQIGANTVRRIYVRYSMEARPSNPLAGLVGGAIMDQLKRGGRQVIQILAREAASRP